MDAIKRLIREVPDFPKAGILFYDITPMLLDPNALCESIQALSAPFRNQSVDVVVGMESRGFIFGPAVAMELGAGFVPIRKKGKLPWKTEMVRFDLEYGSDVLEIHADAVKPGQRVLIVDDLIATGGTAEATADLVERLGGEVVGFSFLVSLAALKGRERLDRWRVHACLEY